MDCAGVPIVNQKTWYLRLLKRDSLMRTVLNICHRGHTQILGWQLVTLQERTMKEIQEKPFREGTASPSPNEKNPLLKLLMRVSESQESLLEDHLLANRINIHRCFNYCLRVHMNKTIKKCAEWSLEQMINQEKHFVQHQQLSRIKMGHCGWRWRETTLHSQIHT